MTQKIVFFLLLLPFACSEGLAQSRIFWGDAGHVAIQSAYLDGTHLETLTTTVSFTNGIAVDTHTGWIYYLTVPIGHGVYGELMRLPVSGSPGSEYLVRTGTARGLAIEYSGGKIYWAAPKDVANASIFRANLDGSQLEEVAHAAGVAWGVAVDPIGGHVYWTTGETILRANIATGVVEDVGPDPQMEPYPAFKGDISIDVQARKMYWTRKGNRSSSGWIGIFRADLDGGNVEKLWDEPYSDAGDIVVDGVNKYVYWTEWTLMADPDGVYIRRARTDQPITWDTIENIVGPPETPSDLTAGLDLFLDPGPALLESPAAEANGISTTTELRWRRVECSPRYDVQIASDADFMQIVYRENTPHTSVEFVAPVAEHRYWWRVHSNACGIASHWANPNWFEVGSSGSLAPTLLTPEQGERTGLTVSFTWTPGSEAAYHTFQLAAVNDFSSTIVDAESLTVADYEVSDLVPDQIYYWRVAGFDAAGRYTFSANQSFSVAGMPSALTLLLPSDGQTEVPAYTAFSWDSAEGADSYHFELSNATDFASVVVDTVLTGTTYEMPAPLAYASEHFWRVCGVNISGEGPCTSRSFTVAIGTATEPSEEIPTVTRLGNAYPNPSSYTVNLPFELSRTGRMRIDLYDVFGRHVATMFNEDLGAGRYVRRLDTERLASGTYVAILTTNSARSRRLFTVIR